MLKQLKCPTCASCNHDKKAKDGICPIISGLDGLPVMCVGEWVNAKHYYLNQYFNYVFNKARIAEKWGGNLFYIDLFSGPGKCYIREQGKEVDGSPLIALKYDFKKYFFVDNNSQNTDALRKRCKGKTDKIEFFADDCNNVVGIINRMIPQQSLSVAFIDPTGLHFKFSSYEKLVNGRKIDLVINFPMGTAIKRNYTRKKFSYVALDDFLGGSGWRSNAKTLASNPQLAIISYFKSNINKIDYQTNRDNYETYEEKLLGDIQITNGVHVSMYHLLYASRSPIGRKLWDIGTKISSSGQIPLKF